MGLRDGALRTVEFLSTCSGGPEASADTFFGEEGLNWVIDSAPMEAGRHQWTVFQIPAPGTFASLFCNSAQKIGNMSRSLKVSQKSSGKAAVEPWEVQGFSKSSGAQALLECVCITC